MSLWSTAAYSPKQDVSGPADSSLIILEPGIYLQTLYFWVWLTSTGSQEEMWPSGGMFLRGYFTRPRSALPVRGESLTWTSRTCKVTKCAVFQCLTYVDTKGATIGGSIYSRTSYIRVKLPYAFDSRRVDSWGSDKLDKNPDERKKLPQGQHKWAIDIRLLEINP